VARCTPLWHGVNLARMFCVRPGGDIDVSTALVNLAVLLAITVVGWRLALTGLERKMVR
jgi:lipooligosaccharide transport system permease protein